MRALRAGTAAVTAGPGAENRNSLLSERSYLLETGLCRPRRSRILAISFKRDAAANLRRRIQERLPEHAERFTSETFDAFTKSIVDRFKDLLPPAWKMKDGYKIGFANRTEVRDFLSNVGGHAPEQIRIQLYGLPDSSFISNILGATDLRADPLRPPEPVTAAEFAVQQWWAQKYRSREVPTVDFVMLNRLAELIIRQRPAAPASARCDPTRFVFVDEFQDTTYAQYSFLRSVFARRGTTVTVVGDRKQRIMGWAGALSDAFAQFEHDFNAEAFVLTSNFRSTQQLVDLQHRFATHLDPASQQQQSQVVPPVGETPIEVWSFSTATREAEAIAAWIAADIEESGRQPSDYALIARQLVADPGAGARRSTRGPGSPNPQRRRQGRRDQAPRPAQGRTRPTAHRPRAPRCNPRRPAPDLARRDWHVVSTGPEPTRPRGRIAPRRRPIRLPDRAAHLVRRYTPH